MAAIFCIPASDYLKTSNYASTLPINALGSPGSIQSKRGAAAYHPIAVRASFNILLHHIQQYNSISSTCPQSGEQRRHGTAAPEVATAPRLYGNITTCQRWTGGDGVGDGGGGGVPLLDVPWRWRT